MSKYIDADKLIAEIRKLLKSLRGWETKNKTYYRNLGKESAYNVVLSIITSIQQEQTHFVDASKMARLNVDILRDWSMRFAPDIRDAIEATAYHFWDLAINSRKEQPEGLHFTPLNRLIQKIPSKNWNDTVNNYAKKLRDCLIKEGYWKDAEVLQGYISYMNGNNVPMATMDEQEQPDVDLDKELKNKKATLLDDAFGPMNGEQSLAIRNFARYFYELGKIARQEE